jgi:cyclopropane fatty-acyl-phospholipid synthase-like methyltransferase
LPTGSKGENVPRLHPDQLKIPGIATAAEERYGRDPFGRRRGLESAGALVLVTQDQLHPPFVDSEEMWADGSRWYEGALEHVRRAARLCELRPGERVLDVGAGLGGPARLLVDEYDVEVIALNVVSRQHDNLISLNEEKPVWGERIRAVLADANEAFPVEQVDVVWSMNMLYHLDDHEAFLSEARRVLASGGRLMIDDWMLTDRATEATRETMARHFASGNLAVVGEFVRSLAAAGLTITAIADCGIVARTHLARYFRETFDRDFRPGFRDLDPQWGEQTAHDFVDSIGQTIELYRREEMTYLQIAAKAT